MLRTPAAVLVFHSLRCPTVQFDTAGGRSTQSFLKCNVTRGRVRCARSGIASCIQSAKRDIHEEITDAGIRRAGSSGRPYSPSFNTDVS